MRMANREQLLIVEKPGFKIHISTAITERVYNVYGFALLGRNGDLFINPVIKQGNGYRDFPLDYLEEDALYSYLADDARIEITYDGLTIPTHLCHISTKKEVLNEI